MVIYILHAFVKSILTQILQLHLQFKSHRSISAPKRPTRFLTRSELVFWSTSHSDLLILCSLSKKNSDQHQFESTATPIAKFRMNSSKWFLLILYESQEIGHCAAFKRTYECLCDAANVPACPVSRSDFIVYLLSFVGHCLGYRQSIWTQPRQRIQSIRVRESDERSATCVMSRHSGIPFEADFSTSVTILFETLKYNNWFNSVTVDLQGKYRRAHNGWRSQDLKIPEANIIDKAAAMVKKSRTITKFALHGLSIPEAFLTVGTQFAEAEKLTSLDLSNCVIEDKGIIALSNRYQFLQYRPCKWHCWLWLRSYVAFAKNLQILNLSNCKAEKQGWYPVQQHISTSSSGIVVLFQCLQRSESLLQTLQELNLSGNKLKEEGTREAEIFVDKSKAIKRLYLAGSCNPPLPFCYWSCTAFSMPSVGQVSFHTLQIADIVEAARWQNTREHRHVIKQIA